VGAYLFVIVCTAIWIAFGWAVASRPMLLDSAWARVRRLPLIAKPVVWVAFFPWLSGLAIWERNWRTPRARRIAVALVALAFIAFWSSVTFGGGGSS
jgi:hypothetical protein